MGTGNIFSAFALACLFSFTACNEKSNNNRTIPLIDEPISVMLDTAGGYAVNRLTGDPVKPLLNSRGDSIKTGQAYFIKGTFTAASGMKRPVIIKTKPPEKKVIEANQQPIKGRPEMVQVKPVQLNSIALSENKDSVILPNNNWIIFSHEQIHAVMKKIAMREPEPARIQPMRYKDNALLDIQYLDIGQGLPYSYVNALHQDKKGFLWFGTDYGLCRYDGTFLTVYTEKEGLIDNRVNSIAEDNEGRIWIATYKGVTVFDGDSFIQFVDKKGLLAGLSTKIQKDITGNMWVALEGFGCVKYDGNAFTFYSTKNNLRDAMAPDFIVENNRTIWFNTPVGIVSYNDGRFVYFKKPFIEMDYVHTVMEDKKRNTWFGTLSGGVVKYDGNYFTRYAKENGLADNLTTGLLIDKNDHVWICTRFKGLNKFDGKYFTAYNTAQGLSEDKISAVTEDRQGNILIATMGGGINKLNSNGFREMFPLSNVNNSRVRPIIKDKQGQLWFGTEAGRLFSYDGITLTRQFERSVNNVTGFRTALVDKDNQLWFGESEGTEIYRYENKQFLYYSLPDKISSNLSLYEDNNGIKWVGTTRKGVAAFNEKGIEYYNEANGFPANKVFVAIQDKKGVLWFGTDGGGLVKYDGRMFTVYSEKQGLFSKSITSITEDGEGNLWMGTLDAGLCRFDGNSFTYYTVKQGLAFNSVWSVKEDHNGQIWAGTDNGLSVLVPGKRKVQTGIPAYSIYSFGLEDGLKATDFNLNSVCIDKNNCIWWGTGKALITRNLSIPFVPDTPLSVTLNHVKVNDRFVDFRNLSSDMNNKIRIGNLKAFQNYPGELSLAYDQNHLTIYFSAIDLKAPHKIKYSYRLIGLDDQWSNPSKETSADFRNLSHGHYKLQVRAIGESNVWTDVLTYKFSVRPAWWQTWWFKMIVSACILASVYLVVRFFYLYRFRKQKALYEKKLAVQMERQRISAEMHDDIGAGLSGVRLLTELTKNKLKEGDAAGDVEKIYQSVGDISARMKEVIWSLNTENDSLENLVHFIVKQVKAQLEYYPAELSIHFPSSIPAIVIRGEARRNIYLAVKEAVNNIIKHSGAGKVELHISCKDHFEIRITDNGKGLDEHKAHEPGNGLKNIQKRMSKLNGTVEIKNLKGLTVLFSIPLTNEL